MRRQLTVFHTVALGIASVAPFESIFILYGTIAGQAGTGLVWIFIAAGLLAIANAYAFSTMARYFPNSGGGYETFRMAVGAPAGTMYIILTLLNWVLVVSTLAVPAASFLNDVHYIMPVPLLASILILIMLGLSLLNVRDSGLVSEIFLIFELAFTVVWIIIAVTHMKVPISVLLSYPRALVGNHFGHAIGIGALIAALPGAMFALSGYESAIHYAEEMQDFRKIIPAVVRAAVISALVYVIAMPMVLLIDHHFSYELNAAIPGEAALVHALPGIAPVFLLYMFVSSFNGGLASYLESSRLVMNAALDGNFGAWLGRWLGRVDRRGVPYMATLIWLVPSIVTVWVTSLSTLLSFTGVTIMITYIFVSFGAMYFYWRVKGRMRVENHGAFRWFPLVPLAVIIPSIVVIVLQPLGYIETSLGVVVVGIIVALLAHRGWHWATPEELVEQSLTSRGGDI